MKNDGHISTFARLLATENITVVHSHDAETASFDMLNRVLTLPRWKVVDNHLYDMLVGHEVAHALWTDNEMDDEKNCLKACSDIDPENPENAMGFLNIVEDARIERMIKNKFPGLRRDFHKGYAYLHNDLDLFELSLDQSKMDDMILTDRLNIHFKLGILGLVHVQFDKDECDFVTRMETTDTFEDVVNLARDLYIHEKKRASSGGHSTLICEGRGSGSGDDDNEGNNGGGQEGGHSGSPLTASMMDNIEREKNAPWRERPEIKDIPIPRLENIIVSPEKIKEYWDNHPDLTSDHASTRIDYNKTVDFFTTECREWMTKEKPTVRNLVKQFEMRKAADEHQRTMITKSGRLDTIKMIDYKWSEDIFARNQTIKEGKNHGIVIFVDWSGSMSSCLESTVKQAITLAMFAQQANIPFEVMAFSDRTIVGSRWDQPRDENGEPIMCEAAKPTFYWDNMQEQHDEYYSMECDCLQLFRFMHNGMNRRDFQSACELFYRTAAAESYRSDSRYLRPPAPLSLSGTPLDECIVAAHKIVDEFRRANSLQIVNCAILSDGSGSSNGLQGCAIRNPYTSKVYGDRPEDRVLNDYNGDTARKSSTELLLKSLKETTGCNLIGMYLHGGKNPCTCWGWYNEHAENNTTVRDRKSYRDENYCIANGRNAAEYDEAYIIHDNTKIEQEVDFADTGEMTHTKLRNTFVKNLKTKGMSRTLIRRFVEIIAR